MIIVDSENLDYNRFISFFGPIAYRRFTRWRQNNTYDIDLIPVIRLNFGLCRKQKIIKEQFNSSDKVVVTTEVAQVKKRVTKVYTAKVEKKTIGPMEGGKYKTKTNIIEKTLKETQESTSVTIIERVGTVHSIDAPTEQTEITVYGIEINDASTINIGTQTDSSFLEDDTSQIMEDDEIKVTLADHQSPILPGFVRESGKCDISTSKDNDKHSIQCVYREQEILVLKNTIHKLNSDISKMKASFRPWEKHKFIKGREIIWDYDRGRQVCDRQCISEKSELTLILDHG